MRDSQNMLPNEIKQQFLSYINDEIILAKDSYDYASRISEDFTYSVGYQFGFLQAVQELKDYMESFFEGEQK